MCGDCNRVTYLEELLRYLLEMSKGHKRRKMRIHGEIK